MDKKQDIDLSPVPGWSGLDHLRSLNPGRSFVSSEPDGDRLRLRYFRREADGAMCGKVWFGPGTEGPPGHAHGGSMAAVLDEAMGGAAWLAGHAVLAAEIRVSYRNMLPIDTVAVLEAWVDGVAGRKVTVRGRLSSSDGITFSESTGLFLTVDVERFGEKIKQAFDALTSAEGRGDPEAGEG